MVITEDSYAAMFEIEDDVAAEKQFKIFDKQGKGYLSYLDVLTGLVLICNDNVEAKLAFLLKLIDYSGKDNINMWELEILLRACGRSYACVKGIEDPPERWYEETCK